MKTMKKKNKRSDMMMKSNMKIIAMLWRMMVIWRLTKMIHFSIYSEWSYFYMRIWDTNWLKLLMKMSMLIKFFLQILWIWSKNNKILLMNIWEFLISKKSSILMLIVKMCKNSNLKNAVISYRIILMSIRIPLIKHRVIYSKEILLISKRYFKNWKLKETLSNKDYKSLKSTLKMINLFYYF